MTTLTRPESTPLPALEAPTARLLLPASAPRAVWEDVRRTGIGGSDVAALLGLDKYKGPHQVFAGKHAIRTLQVDGDDDPTVPAAYARPEKVSGEAVRIGSAIEGFIADQFSERSGVPIATPPGMLVHHEHPEMLANVDKYAMWDPDTGHVQGPVECKNRSEWQITDWEDGVPDAPAIQCHWYMAVGGWDAGYVAALVGGNKLRWHRIERDEEMIGHLTEYCRAWFARHVVEGFPPPPDGHAATTHLFAKLWDVKAEAVAEIDLTEARELRARRAELTAAAAEIEAQLKAVENQMRYTAGDADTVRAEGRIAWTCKANAPFASSKFVKDNPKLAARYMRQVDVVDTDRLKAEEPVLFASYRSRVLRVPKAEV